MQENWCQRYAVLAMNTFFIQRHRCIAGALFTKGTVHPQAPHNPGALVVQTCMREQAQLSSPSSLLQGKRSEMGMKAGCNGGSCPWQAQELHLWLLSVANAFVKFDLHIQKENLFYPCCGELHRGIVFGELTYYYSLLINVINHCLPAHKSNLS